MTRITNDMRAAIIAKAQEKAGIKAEESALQVRRDKWAEKVRVHAIGGAAAVRKAEALAAKIKDLRSQLPSGLNSNYEAVKTDTDIMVNVGGRRVRAYFQGEPRNRIAPYEVAITAREPLAIEWEAIENDARELLERRDTISAQVGGTLQKFNTVKQLIEAWPEAAELLPPSEPASRTNLPAVPVAALNQLVGLPSEKKAAKRENKTKTRN
jgi:hypothetical protein